MKAPYYLYRWQSVKDQRSTPTTSSLWTPRVADMPGQSGGLYLRVVSCARCGSIFDPFTFQWRPGRAWSRGRDAGQTSKVASPQITMVIFGRPFRSDRFDGTESNSEGNPVRARRGFGFLKDLFWLWLVARRSKQCLRTTMTSSKSRQTRIVSKRSWVTRTGA